MVTAQQIILLETDQIEGVFDIRGEEGGVKTIGLPAQIKAGK